MRTFEEKWCRKGSHSSSVN